MARRRHSAHGRQRSTRSARIGTLTAGLAWFPCRGQAGSARMEDQSGESPDMTRQVWLGPGRNARSGPARQARRGKQVHALQPHGRQREARSGKTQHRQVTAGMGDKAWPFLQGLAWLLKSRQARRCKSRLCRPGLDGLARSIKPRQARCSVVGLPRPAPLLFPNGIMEPYGAPFTPERING